MNLSEVQLTKGLPPLIMASPHQAVVVVVGCGCVTVCVACSSCLLSCANQPWRPRAQDESINTAMQCSSTLSSSRPRHDADTTSQLSILLTPTIQNNHPHCHGSLLYKRWRPNNLAAMSGTLLEQTRAAHEECERQVCLPVAC